MTSLTPTDVVVELTGGEPESNEILEWVVLHERTYSLGFRRRDTEIVGRSET